MKNKYLYALIATMCCLFCSCADEGRFTSSSSYMVSFSVDTVKLDTVFSNVPTATSTFWVYNRGKEGVRFNSVRLSRGASSGYRVNVDGIYLGERTQYAVNNLELRAQDSMRVFVELTAPMTGNPQPVEDEDQLVFTTEGGAVQRVCLSAYSWDAIKVERLKVSKDTTLQSMARPIVVYGTLRVDSGATLTVAAGTTLYFHQDAGMDVYGTLSCAGTLQDRVVMRGDRLDRMFDYLPYDRVPGQWQGLRFYTSSYHNKLLNTEIRNTYDGIVVDSSNVDLPKLQLHNATVLNCQGYGLKVSHAQVSLKNTLIANTWRDVVSVTGGATDINDCTFAQFYPFDANRGWAMHIAAQETPTQIKVSNSLITGYADDQLMISSNKDTEKVGFEFSHCVIRTPRVTTSDSVYFKDVTFEPVNDTLHSGAKQFVEVNEEKQRYDFHLDSLATAIGKGSVQTSLPYDHDGVQRMPRPDVGAFQHRELKNNIETK